MELEDDELSPCEMCGGQLGSMGTLGWTQHLQCRNCGMQFSINLKKKDDDHGSDDPLPHP